VRGSTSILEQRRPICYGRLLFATPRRIAERGDATSRASYAEKADDRRLRGLLLVPNAATVKKTSMELGGNAPFIVF
jgi:hypothetical protein